MDCDCTVAFDGGFAAIGTDETATATAIGGGEGVEPILHS